MVLQTAFVFIGACSGGGVTDTPPLVGPDTTTTGGVVQRTSLTVLVAINPEDVAWASQAGVSTTGVTVRLAKSGEIGAEASAVTDGTGQVRFQQLLEGLYQVSVERTLTPAEVAKLVPTDRDRSLLAAGTQVVISPPTPRTIEVGLVASRRGSLVISEVYGHSPFVVNSTYGWAQYYEIQNATDSTIYLDGLLLFRDPLNYRRAFLDGIPCSANEPMRSDTTAVWAHRILRFPGTGRDFPLASGAFSVVALDALNHRVATGRDLPDLSKANFEEFATDADTDNPFAANMIRITEASGLSTRGSTFGAGVMIGIALGIARDTMGLRRATATNTAQEAQFSVWRIPREAILDVAGFEAPTEKFMASGAYQAGLRQCLPWAPSVFERAPSLLLDSDLDRALRRRSVGRSVSGVEILQRTRTGARDFEVAPPLRRSLNK
jgi:hypothetical protein